MAAKVTYTQVNGLVIAENRGGVNSFFMPDTTGSLAQTRDNAGNLTYSAEYWPFGETQSETGANASRWSFVGLLGYAKDTASMLYIRARFYRPSLGRWQTVDPKWPRYRAYRYSRNDPVGFIDTTGNNWRRPCDHLTPDPSYCLMHPFARECNPPGSVWYCLTHPLDPDCRPGHPGASIRPSPPAEITCDSCYLAGNQCLTKALKDYSSDGANEACSLPNIVQDCVQCCSDNGCHSTNSCLSFCQNIATAWRQAFFECFSSPAQEPSTGGGSVGPIIVPRVSLPPYYGPPRFK
ncbi:MAG: hypothetical protein JSS65_15155 [Armatimonadetes bacterium]|nr:hypothetical protein [Armatimonadota bacterium]